MHFQNSESRNVVSQHNPVGTGGLVHTLYDLKVAVSEEEVVLIDSHTPGVRQACHYGDAVTPIYIPALNLWRQAVECRRNKYQDDISAYHITFVRAI